MIQEYYLHLLCGVNGEQDQSTGAGRLAIAALMSGFGLNASTKKDLQTRVGWRTTPGCFLGQKELSADDYYCRNYEETRFAVSLVNFRKVNRTMNYQLDWSILNGEWDFQVNSPIWVNIAKIYWLGYFLFGRNVIPPSALETMRERFNPVAHEQREKVPQLFNHFVMQFMRNIGLPLDRVRARNRFTENPEDCSRFDIFGSLAMSLNWAENSPGFYTAGAMISSLAPTGFNLRNAEELFSDYTNSRAGRYFGHYAPLNKMYYYQFGMGAPSMPSNPSRMPSNGRDILPLLYADRTRTPQQEAASNYSQVRGATMNYDFFRGNIQTWMTAAVLWEYHLMLTGQPMFPLQQLIDARTEKEWTEETIVASLVYLNPANHKNCSVSQIVRFNLERQNQV